MKIILLVPLITALNWNIHQSNHFSAKTTTDTSHITHLQDGLISEWPDSVFQNDKGTHILYAADNDAENLYVAVKIPDFPMQMKMMRQGMSLYIDLKGKKKENRGIEFPIKRKSEGGFSGGGFGNNQGNEQNQGANQQRGSFDKKAMRSRFAIYLLSMKLFGFTDDEPAPQELQRPGSVNLNYSWDSTDVMYMEYVVPLNMLGEAASLNNKTISLGWKINGLDMPTSSFSSSAPTTTNTRRVVSVPSGTSPNQGNVFNNRGPSPADVDKMMQEQSFWTKYTFH